MLADLSLDTIININISDLGIQHQNHSNILFYTQHSAMSYYTNIQNMKALCLKTKKFCFELCAFYRNCQYCITAILYTSLGGHIRNHRISQIWPLVYLRNNPQKPEFVSSFNLGNIVFVKKIIPELQRGIKCNENNVTHVKTGYKLWLS